MIPPSRLVRTLLIPVLALVPVLASSAPSVEERLLQLEARVQTLAAENAALKARLDPLAAADQPAVRPAGKETRLAVGGFLMGQADFGGAVDSRFAGVRDRFYFRRARLHVAGAFAEHFDFKAELDLQGNTLGAGTGQLARANEIYVGWNRFPQAVVRFGQLKPAFGAEQLLSDTKTPTIERHLGNDRLTDSRQLGLSLAGEFAAQRAGYLLTLGNGNGANVSGNDNSSFLKAARVHVTILDDPAAGRLVVGANTYHTADTGLAKSDLGFDAVPGGAVDHLFTGTRTGWGGDVLWHHRRLDLSAEYLRARYRPLNAFPAATVEAAGWHLTAAAFVVPGHLQGVVRREHFDPNLARAGDATRQWTLGLNWLLKGDDLKLMVDYLFGRSAVTHRDEGRLLARMQVVY